MNIYERMIFIGKSNTKAKIIKIIFYEIFMMFVLPFVLSGSSFTWYGMLNNDVWVFQRFLTANSTARQVYEAAYTYAELCEKENAFLRDGAYIGSTVYSDEKFPKDGSPEGLNKLLNRYTGRYGHNDYYCVIIKDGKPIRAYYSENSEMLAFADYFLYASEQGITIEKCPRRTIIGGYPGGIGGGFDNSIIRELGRNKPQGTIYSEAGYDADKLIPDYKRHQLGLLIENIIGVLVLTQFPLFIGILAGIIIKKLKAKKSP